MAGVMFGLILHFQYAYGWSPVRAGLANLPLILTMLGATPITEFLVRRFGQRIACLVGTVLWQARSWASRGASNTAIWRSPSSWWFSPSD